MTNEDSGILDGCIIFLVVFLVTYLLVAEILCSNKKVTSVGSPKLRKHTKEGFEKFGETYADECIARLETHLALESGDQKSKAMLLMYKEEKENYLIKEKRQTMNIGWELVYANELVVGDKIRIGEVLSVKAASIYRANMTYEGLVIKTKEKTAEVLLFTKLARRAK